MDIYSPKSQKTCNFKKNTMKGNVNINYKTNSMKEESAIIFEFEKMDNQKENKNEKKNFISEKLDFFKLKFYERMKLFFDYEEKSKENERVKST
jgi:hypothetical protein